MNNTIIINNHPVSIIRSKRKSISLQIDSNARITCRAPRHVPEAELRRFIESKEEWIKKHLAGMQERKNERDQLEGISHTEVLRLAEQALDVIPKRVEYFAPLIGVRYGRITIRNQKTRWGSCSAKGNLNFNCLLMLTPPEIIDYVVVHELCHRKEMNHSPAFWSEVERILPDYRQRRKWLKQNGPTLVARMKKGSINGDGPL